MALRLLPVAPNFPHDESLTWGTQILRGASGAPQRIAVGSALPRQRLAYYFTLRDTDQINAARAVLYDQRDGLWPIPLWGQRMLYRGVLSSGATSIAIDTTNAEFLATNDHVTGRVLIWRRDGDTVASEIATVSAVAAGALTVSTVANSYTNPWIVPCRTGYVVTKTPLRYHGLNAATLSMAFEVVDNWFVDAHTPDAEIDDIEIVHAPGQLTGSLDQQIDPEVIPIDNNCGRLAIVAPQTYPTGTRPHGWVCQSRADCYALRQRLYAWLGRQKSVLVPTHRPDLTLAAPAASDATTIDVAANDAVLYDGGRWRYYVSAKIGGTPVVKKVTGIATVSTSVERLTLSSAFGTALAAGSTLSWVERCRNASDTVALRWLFQDKLTCQIQWARTWSPLAVQGDGVFGMGVLAG